MKLTYVEAPEVSRSIEKDPGKVKGDLGYDIADSQVLEVVPVVAKRFFNCLPWVKFLDLIVELLKFSLTPLYVLYDSELLYYAT